MGFGPRSLGLMVFFSLSAAHAAEDVFTVSGRLFTDQYVRIHETTEDRFAQSTYSAWLELHSNVKDSVNVHAVGSGTYFAKTVDSARTSRTDFRLREGYLSYSNEMLEFKAGQQIIPWGKSDGVNPTDYWTAKDQTILNPDEEVKRLGAPAASLIFTPQNGTSPLNLTFIAQSTYPKTKLLIRDSVLPTTAPVPIVKYPADTPLFSADTFEFGGKISYLQSDVDFSFSGFRGYAQMPHYEFDGTKIYSTYAAESAIGGDLSFTADAYIVRVESAVHFPDNGMETDPRFSLVEPWHWDTVAGVERPVGGDFRIQVQGILKYHLYYQDPNLYVGKTIQDTQIQRAVGKANALVLNYVDRTTLGGTFRFAYQPDHGDWTADIFVLLYSAQGIDYVIRPQVGFKAYEGVKLTAGADIYGGNNNRPLASLRDFSAGFFEAKWVF